EYTLPDGKEFTPPENQVFVGWKVGDSEEVKTAGTKITVKDNTKLTAVYEEKPVEITFDKGDGTGAMEKQTAKKGSKYTLPVSTFTAPENKEFEGWKVGDSEEVKAAGTEITVNDNTKLTAVYKDKTSGGTTPGTEDPGTKPGEEPGVKPSPDTQVYNPWWPIWFGSSEVKPATPAEPKVEYERGLHRKYLYGYKDHTVRPEGLITRAEAAALIARLAELDMSNNMKPNFKDTKSAWYNTAINAVVAKNLMFADKDGDFRPNEPITRGEFARALFFIDKKNNAVAPFADVKGHAYEEAINQAYGNDRIKGYPDGTFKPDATITRAEAATILNNYADRNVTFKGMVEVHKDVVKFTDINESHWAYYEIMEAANTHEYQREKGTIPETWLEILKK
uniref:S-layer homology domain-containing protein n=1 Tax=Peptoniphilus duerdenii TaxID=507750 RepID=UPI00288B7291